MTPTCPSGYDCRFTPKNIHPHYWVHWWDGPWGIVVGILAVVALTAVLCTVAVQWKEIRDNRQRYIQEKEARAAKLAIEEQRTMQIDSAKGNPEMLKVIREMQR